MLPAHYFITNVSQKPADWRIPISGGVWHTLEIFQSENSFGKGSMNYWLIFLTGLTTGGLSCLAVQGGLLATAISGGHKVPAISVPSAKKRKATKKRQSDIVIRVDAKEAWPVVYFLVAKLAAYTFLGALLGALGSVVQITVTAQAVMQIIAALYMLVTALNLLDMHPIFRYFVIQPPKALSRLVRNSAKSESILAPALLGFLTILIPCGTTQAMEVLAIGSGNPLIGALVMFIFVLGTSPTFFVLGFVATQLQSQAGRWFTRIAAALILVLAYMSFNGGLTALGSPFAPSHIIASLFPGQYGVAVAAPIVDGVQEMRIEASGQGYTPNHFTAQANQPIRLRLITNDTFSCSRLFTIPSLGIETSLPLSGETVIDLPALPAGDVYFSCSMGMFTGLIQVEKQSA
jgi:sulfite exporter TauE/SafE